MSLVIKSEAGLLIKPQKKNLLHKTLDFSVNLISAHFSLTLQVKPKEVQATRDFAEPRKLALAANDLVTLIEHRWVRKKKGGIKIVKEKLLPTQWAFC